MEKIESAPRFGRFYLYLHRHFAEGGGGHVQVYGCRHETVGSTPELENPQCLGGLCLPVKTRTKARSRKVRIVGISRASHKNITIRMKPKRSYALLQSSVLLEFPRQHTHTWSPSTHDIVTPEPCVEPSSRNTRLEYNVSSLFILSVWWMLTGTLKVFP